MFHAPEARVLVSGDALWENGFGVVFPRLFGDERALAETRATLETIAALELDVVVPGHGRPFGEVQAALGRALERVAYYEADLGRLARHCVKVLLAFTLLEKRALALDDLPAYLERVPVYREINRRHLGMAPAALAAWLASELERAGVARRSGGLLHAASG
jgi:glyoxylase-like metal-dependent hydrolase (beta-lactamase superfamily II)